MKPLGVLMYRIDSSTSVPCILLMCNTTVEDVEDPNALCKRDRIVVYVPGTPFAALEKDLMRNGTYNSLETYAVGEATARGNQVWRLEKHKDAVKCGHAAASCLEARARLPGPDGKQNVDLNGRVNRYLRNGVASSFLSLHLPRTSGEFEELERFGASVLPKHRTSNGWSKYDTDIETEYEVIFSSA
jgi:hypothetical protein